MRLAVQAPLASRSGLPQRAAAEVAEARRHGRGALSNRSGRFESEERVVEDDGWGVLGQIDPLRMELTRERPRSIITRNESPDISFDRSINPYRGCEHGCVYCYARPTHAYMGLSAGLDFETRLFVKDGAADLLRRELSAPDYKPKMIALGSNTDPYQPIERTERATRMILEVLAETKHPVGIVTKSAGVLRDLDIIAAMARQGLAKVALSLTTLDPKLARVMEPRASTPLRRLEAIAKLAAAGVPTTVLVAPVIPGLNDSEIESILERASAAGADEAGYVMLRLPLEIEGLFSEWLIKHFPDRFRRIMSLVRSTRGGKTYDASWGKWMVGTGPYAWATGRRFELAAARLGLNRKRARLRTDLFAPPPRAVEQLRLL